MSTDEKNEISRLSLLESSKSGFVTTDSFVDLERFNNKERVIIPSINEISSNSSIDDDRLNFDEDEESKYVTSEEFKNEDKHIFVLSKAGKPVYSLHGNEEKLVTKMATIIGLISVVEFIRPKDALKEIIAGKRKFVFLIKEFLVLVAVSKKNETTTYLNLLLNYIYNQIICLLTHSKLSAKFQRSNFDLRKILSGDNTDKFFLNMIEDFEINPSYLLNAVKCLPVQDTVRTTVGKTIATTASKLIKELAFVLLISNDLLVCLVRLKQFKLDPKDFHLLCAYIKSSDLLKNRDTLIPICLPNFRNDGYLFAFLSSIDANLSLILLTASNDDQLLAMRETKSTIVTKCEKSLSIVRQIAEERENYDVSVIGVPELRHFLLKNRLSAQWHCPNYSSPFSSEKERKRLLTIYEQVHTYMHVPGKQLVTFWSSSDQLTIIGSISSEFEIYAVFSPLTSKIVACNCIQKIIRWSRKVESKYMIWNSPTFG